MIKVGDKFRVTNAQRTRLHPMYEKKHILKVTGISDDCVYFKDTVTHTGAILYCMLDCLQIINPISNPNKELEFLDRLHYNRFNL